MATATTTTRFTREDYIAGRCTHIDYYRQFTTDATRLEVETCIGLDRLLASRDPHLNDIPLVEWDRVPHRFNGVALRECDDYLTAAGWVCIAKEAARQLIEGQRTNERRRTTMNNDTNKHEVSQMSTSEVIAYLNALLPLGDFAPTVVFDDEIDYTAEEAIPVVESWERRGAIKWSVDKREDCGEVYLEAICDDDAADINEDRILGAICEFVADRIDARDPVSPVDLAEMLVDVFESIDHVAARTYGDVGVLTRDAGFELSIGRGRTGRTFNITITRA